MRWGAKVLLEGAEGLKLWRPPWTKKNPCLQTLPIPIPYVWVFLTFKVKTVQRQFLHFSHNCRRKRGQARCKDIMGRSKPSSQTKGQLNTTKKQMMRTRLQPTRNTIQLLKLLMAKMIKCKCATNVLLIVSSPHSHSNTQTVLLPIRFSHQLLKIAGVALLKNSAKQ